MRFAKNESSPKSVVYKSFKGVDFSKDAILCDKEHSPNAMNMISDKSGLPEKRAGTRTLHRLKAPINGMFYGDISGERTLLVHGGNTLYKVTATTSEVLAVGLNNHRSTGFFMQSGGKTKLFLLTGGQYICWDGKEFLSVADIAYVPTVLIGKQPTGGGTPLEPVNMLQPKRCEKFAGSGSALVYQLASNALDPLALKIEIRTASGMQTLTENKGFSVNRETGQVTFVTPPAVSPVSGEDNVYITYAKSPQGYAQRITGCLFCAYYGLGGANRVFLAGNPQYKAYDRWCEVNDPTYFPDLNYSIVGTDNTAIMGYAKIGEYLVIIKEDNQQDATIYVRSAEMMGDKAVFPLKQGVTGVGAISPYSFVNLIDEPLFLSRTGVYAVTSNTVTAERTLQNRSYMADNRLCKEENLQNAIAAEWNGYYLLGINSRVYLFDSRRKTMVEGGGFCYESYLWDNIPAVYFLAVGETLYFGTADGRVCRFNTDIPTADCYMDDDKPVAAFWETKADNDGMAALLKTMQKKGCSLTVKPAMQTGVDIFVSRDGEPYELLVSKGFALFSWENLNFGQFTFSVSETPKVAIINRKIKKYNSLQFKLVNDKPSQSFGLFELSKEFTVNNYKKR